MRNLHCGWNIHIGPMIYTFEILEHKMMESEETTCQIDTQKWEKKRSYMFIIFCLHNMVFGMVTIVKNATSWIYTTTLVNTNHPYSVYGFINACNFVVAIACTPIIGRLVDKYQRPKLVLIVVNYSVIAGNILYSMYISPYFPIAGSCFMGLQRALIAMMAAEIVKLYPADQHTKKLSIFSNAQRIGAVPMSIVLSFLVDINFSIGWVKITYGNFLVVQDIVMFSLLQIVNIFFMHDLFRTGQRTSNSTCSEKESEESNQSENQEEMKPSACIVLLTPDIIFIISLQALIGHLQIANVRYLPVLVITKLHYSPLVLNISMFVLMFVTFLGTLVTICMKITSKCSYYICLISLAAFPVTGVCNFLLSPNNNQVLNYFLLLVYFTLIAFLDIADSIFIIGITAKLVIHDYKGFAEGLGLGAKYIGNISGTLVTGIMVLFFKEYFICICIVIVMHVSTLFLKRNSYKNPTPVKVTVK